MNGNPAIGGEMVDPLILVDEQDRELGACAKLACHTGEGLLHRAFSILVFNAKDELLLQRRGANKLLWPHYWSNTCCSHPRWGETMAQAVARRLPQEFGFSCSLEFLYRFRYAARFGAVGAEREYCWVYAGRYDGPVRPDPAEIAEWCFVSAAALDAELDAQADRFTPWFRMEWEYLRKHHVDLWASGEPG